MTSTLRSASSPTAPALSAPRGSVTNLPRKRNPVQPFRAGTRARCDFGAMALPFVSMRVPIPPHTECYGIGNVLDMNPLFQSFLGSYR
jgi:hypothetical protein